MSAASPSYGPVEKVGQMAIVLRGIWMARNKKVWDGNSLTPELVMQWSAKQIEQRKVAQNVKWKVSIRGTYRQTGADNWKPPDVGRAKINVDASVHTNIHQNSVGLVVRDHLGRFCKTKVIRIGGEARWQHLKPK